LERIDCADPAAQCQIRHRVDGYGVALGECATVPGSTNQYEWALDGEGLAGLSTDKVLFCWGSAGVDP
jgi:hypothetical protein